MEAFRRRLGQSGYWPLLCVILLVACCYLAPTFHGMLQHWNTKETPSWVGSHVHYPHQEGDARDLDTWFIHGGLVKAPRFKDTWQWWVGTWAGQVPFYRPITSLVFWTEWQICGDKEPRYLLFALALHLLVVVQFGRAAYALFRYFRCPGPQWAMLLAGLVFVDGLYSFPTRQTTNFTIFALWKNQPDALCALFFLLAVQSYLSALAGEREESISPDARLKPGKRGVSERVFSLLPSSTNTGKKRARLWAVGWFALACLSKEAGVLLPFLLLWLEWPHLLGRDRTERQAGLHRLWPHFAVLSGFMVVRTLVLSHVTNLYLDDHGDPEIARRMGKEMSRQLLGFRYGDNSDWPLRFLNEIAGPILRISYLQRPLILVLGCSLAGVAGWWFWRGRRRNVGVKPQSLLVGGSCLFALLALLGLLVTPGGFTTLHLGAIFRGYTSHTTVSSATGVALFIIGVGSVFLYHRRLAILGYIWVVTTLVFPLVTPSIRPFLVNGIYYSYYTNMHRYYLVEAGFALMMGAGLMLWKRSGTARDAEDETRQQSDEIQKLPDTEIWSEGQAVVKVKESEPERDRLPL